MSTTMVRRFAVILGAVALLAVGKAWTLSAAVEAARDDGRLVNVAGRQRMLSQRIAKASLAYGRAMANDSVSSDDYRTQLRESLDEFRRSHALVRDRSTEAGFTGEHSDAVTQRFQSLQPTFERVLEGAGAVLRNSANPTAVNAVLAATDTYLPRMNEIVFALADESERRIAAANSIVWWGAAATALLVVAAGLLVLKPAATALRERQAKLLDALAGLREAKASAEAALESHKESLAFNTAILDTAADAIIVITADGRIAKANSAARAMFGADGLVGEEITRFMPAATALLHPSYVEAAVAGGRAGLLREPTRVVAQHDDGEEFPIELSVSRIAGIDEVAFVGVLRDMSQREAVERRLAQAEKLESIGSLAAGVSHEINTPLQFVTANMLFLQNQSDPLIQLLDQVEELVQLDAGRPDEAALSDLRESAKRLMKHDLKEAIDDTAMGAQRITEIVRAMKEYTHSSDAAVTFDLTEIVQQAVVITRNRTKGSAELEVDLAEEAFLVGNRSSISQTIVNLIVNAADAIDDAGLEPESGRIALTVEADEGEVRFSCRDNGCGMPESVQKRAFDPFFTTKEVGVGSGQGLAIAYKAVVNQHHGEIEIDSVEGEGTTIRITLPTAPDEAGAESSVLNLAGSSP